MPNASIFAFQKRDTENMPSDLKKWLNFGDVKDTLFIRLREGVLPKTDENVGTKSRAGRVFPDGSELTDMFDYVMATWECFSWLVRRSCTHLAAGKHGDVVEEAEGCPRRVALSRRGEYLHARLARGSPQPAHH